MKTSNFIIIGFLVLMINACQKPNKVDVKKQELKAKKEELQKIKASIIDLEKELAILDPEFGRKNRKETLVTTTSVEKGKFDLVVEATGSPDGINEAIALVRPEGTVVIKTTSFKKSVIDLANVVVNELHLIGSRCGDIQLALNFMKKN